MPFTLAIVGRPNVGKSTLFNRLVGRRRALVDDRPGLTRDLRRADAQLGPLSFDVIDTAGIEDVHDESLAARMRRLTERAVDEADGVLFLIDARAGVTPTDEAFAERLRRRAGDVVLAANKAEGRAGEAGVLEGWSLGLGEPLALSAEHGEGLADLLAALQPLAEAAAERAPATEVAVATEAGGESAPTPEQPLQIAVLGRPNVGKSTLVNRIIGDERLLTGPETGITRDAVSVGLDWAGTPVRIFDTAGMRKRARVEEGAESLAVADGLRAVRFAEVVVLLVEAGVAFETQDLRLADLAEREGRSVVVAVNKWDLLAETAGLLGRLRGEFERLLPQIRGAPLVGVSAKTGHGVGRLHTAVRKAHTVWNRRVGTGALNRWLAERAAHHPPPAPGGRRLRLRYMTQVRTRPPGFVLMCSQPEKMPDAYRRYLVQGLRDDFDLPGTPIRLTLRSQAEKNPYGRGKGPRTRKPRGGKRLPK